MGTGRPGTGFSVVRGSRAFGLFCSAISPCTEVHPASTRNRPGLHLVPVGWDEIGEPRSVSPSAISQSNHSGGPGNDHKPLTVRS